jgi:hypothetical protein
MVKHEQLKLTNKLTRRNPPSFVLRKSITPNSVGTVVPIDLIITRAARKKYPVQTAKVGSPLVGKGGQIVWLSDLGIEGWRAFSPDEVFLLEAHLASHGTIQLNDAPPWQRRIYTSSMTERLRHSKQGKKNSFRRKVRRVVFPTTSQNLCLAEGTIIAAGEKWAVTSLITAPPKNTGNALTGDALWVYLTQGVSWISISYSNSALLEESFHSHPTHSLVSLLIKGIPWSADLGAMELVRADGLKIDVATLKRIPYSPRSDWRSPPLTLDEAAVCQQYSIPSATISLQVSQETREYLFAAALFCRQSGKPMIDVQGVDVFLNSVLSARYEKNRKRLAEAERLLDEIWVFHCTAPSNVESIMTQGFLVGGVGVPVANGSSYGKRARILNTSLIS